MLKLFYALAQGSGTPPKEIGINSTILLYTDTEAENYEWEMLSQPDGTTSVLANPVSRQTRIGPLNKYGVYVIKLIVDRYLPTEKTRTVALSVPETISVYNPAEVAYEYHGKVKNGGFELPGASPGLALLWDTVDTGGVLVSPYAGTTRGRIIPVNFTPTENYAMCIGDDQGNDVTTFEDGEEFSISQEIDFTNTKQLVFTFKYNKP